MSLNGTSFTSELEFGFADTTVSELEGVWEVEVEGVAGGGGSAMEPAGMTARVAGGMSAENCDKGGRLSAMVVSGVE